MRRAVICKFCPPPTALIAANGEERTRRLIRDHIRSQHGDVSEADKLSFVRSLRVRPLTSLLGELKARGEGEFQYSLASELTFGGKPVTGFRNTIDEALLELRPRKRH